MKIAFDLGGVISKYPDLFRPILEALHGHPDTIVCIVSDMPLAKIQDMLDRNRLRHLVDRVYSADYKTHGENCKAVLCAVEGIDVLVDDHMGYLTGLGSPPLRLLVMPDPLLDYYAPTWQTDGSEGSYGRRVPPGSKRPPEDRQSKREGGVP